MPVVHAPHLMRGRVSRRGKGVGSRLQRLLRNQRGSPVECHSECSEESKGFHPKTAQFCEQRLWILHFAPLRSE